MIAYYVISYQKKRANRGWTHFFRVDVNCFSSKKKGMLYEIFRVKEYDQYNAK